MTVFSRALLLIALHGLVLGGGCRSTNHAEHSVSPASAGAALTDGLGGDAADEAPSDKPASTSSQVVGAPSPQTASAKPSGVVDRAPSAAPVVTVDCKVPPQRVCCEALTPACNDCRAKQQRAYSDWQDACLKTDAADASKAGIDCRGAPPVSECCGDASEECRNCRAAALTKVLAWKEACSDLDQLSCDHRPVLSECCDALLPSCSQCLSRNRRLSDAWTKRCGKN